MTADAAVVARRFWILRATRWLPTGLLIPVLVLLLIDRGLSLGQIGAAAAAQGLVVFLLELPTGGLADSLGRRPVLMFATVMEAASLTVLLGADSVSLVVAVFVLQGIYRALESGPLDAWFVDAAYAVDPEADIERALARGGSVLGLAIAAGALLASALVAIDPVDNVSTLALPIIVAVVLRGLDLVAITMLMTEDRSHLERRPVSESVREVPAIIRHTVETVRRSRVLAALIAVEFLWGFGGTTFEALAPAKLAEAVGTTTEAAAIFGPAVIAAWVASAMGAALVPHLSSRIGLARAAMVLHLLQASLVVGMALSAGPLGVVAFYVLTLSSHGAINPAYQALLHRQADAAHRTTVVSAASMAAHPGAAIGGLALGALADRASISTAMIVGAIALCATIPFYRPAQRSLRTDPLESERVRSLS